MTTLFKQQLNQAVDEFSKHGYRDAAVIAFWIYLLRQALKSDFDNDIKTDIKAKSLLSKRFESTLKKKRPIPQIKVNAIRPDLRRELDRRLKAVEMLNQGSKDQATDDVIKRFEGWATSVPVGGTRVRRSYIVDFISKPVNQIKFDYSRVLEDQLHKMEINVESLIANHFGAVAGIWNSKWRLGEPYRHAHADVDKEVFTLRDNWAIKEGLMKVGELGYTDEMEAPGELPYCRCSYNYVYDIKDLPDRMLTNKGRERL